MTYIEIIKNHPSEKGSKCPLSQCLVFDIDAVILFSLIMLNLNPTNWYIGDMVEIQDIINLHGV